MAVVVFCPRDTVRTTGLTARRYQEHLELPTSQIHSATWKREGSWISPISLVSTLSWRSISYSVIFSMQEKNVGMHTSSALFHRVQPTNEYYCCCHPVSLQKGLLSSAFTTKRASVIPFHFKKGNSCAAAAATR